MMNKKLKSIALSIVLMATIFAVNPVAAHAEWKQNSTGWWFANGDSWYTGWQEIGGKWYYFRTDGYMARDCYIGNYRLNSQGYWNGVSQELSVKYPSNWTKATNASGDIIYNLDKKGTRVIELTGSLYGLSNKEFLDQLVKVEKSKESIDQINISQQNINGKTVDVLDFKLIDKETKMTIKMHQVIFYGSDKAYIISMAGAGDITSANMNSFNEMLKTVTF